MTESYGQHRDVRIDLVRGIALLVLFSDHVPSNIVANYTPMAVGLSDMSDVFVFLSGYSCGISYGRRLAKSGICECVKRAWTRAAQIFVVKILVTTLALVTLLCVEKWVSPIFFGVRWNMELVRLHPLETLLELEAFRLELFQFFVLALYVPFLLILPVVIWGLLKHPQTTTAVSALIYGAAQLFPEAVKLPEPWSESMFFNPFAWQFLFFAACSLALMKAEQRSRFRPQFPMAVFAVIVLLFVVLLRLQSGITVRFLIDKRNLGLLRLFHFAAIVVVGWKIVPSSLVLSRLSAIQPIVICGRYPLVGYCTGGVLAILGEAALCAYSQGWQTQLIVNIAGWCGCLAATSAWKSYGIAATREVCSVKADR